ncbi:MAG: hypothetical protein J6I64_01395, partial [Lachnospiraceae bacterium]|nr:hypothetical protein [Lachnospiraceae bacterium]
MKKKESLANSRFAVSIVCLVWLCALCFLFSGCNPMEWSDLGEEDMRCTVTGRYIRARGGGDIILIEEGYSGMAASYMGNSTGDETIFDEFETGDRIRIICNSFREISPMQTDVYECEWLEAGSIKDIPQEHIEHLTLMGHMDEPITASFDWTWEEQEIHIQATYGALWTYSDVKPHISDEMPKLGVHLHQYGESDVTAD